MKYPFKRFSTLARVAGANYRVLAHLDHHRSAHYGHLWAMWTKMEMPFNLWMGRGRLLNPYLSGVIIDFLRKEMRPRDLQVVPDQMSCFLNQCRLASHRLHKPGMKDFLEWSTLRSWMQSWL